MNKFSKELIESLTEACEHAEGKPGGVRVHVVEVPDVRAIRRQLRMSQQEFACVYRIPLATLKNWEQGRRQPGCPCCGVPRTHRQAPARGQRGNPRSPKATATVSDSDVKAFATCVCARTVYMHYRAIFEEPSPEENPLKELSPYFFGDLGLIFREYLFCKSANLLTPLYRGQSKPNRRFLAANADFSTDPAGALEFRADARRRLSSLVRLSPREIKSFRI